MTKKINCTQEDFLREVTKHGIEIIADSGIHRHIIFKNPESSNCWFELITWPGTLCINGDCGTYVFSRLPDMFNFFRQKNDKSDLSINPYYWGEKLQAIDRCSGFVEFDGDAFSERVKERFDSFIESHEEIDDESKNQLWDEIKEEVLYYSDSEHEAYRAAHDFSCEIGESTFRFTDFLDGGGTETYTARYLWCLYAIVWGIRQYDLAKEKVETNGQL